MVERGWGRVINSDNPTRNLAVHGTVVDITEEGAADHLDGLSRELALPRPGHGSA